MIIYLSPTLYIGLNLAKRSDERKRVNKMYFQSCKAFQGYISSTFQQLIQYAFVSLYITEKLIITDVVEASIDVSLLNPFRKTFPALKACAERLLHLPLTFFYGIRKSYRQPLFPLWADAQ